MNNWFIRYLSGVIIVFIAFFAFVSITKKSEVEKTNSSDISLIGGCTANDLSGELRYDAKTAIYDGKQVNVSYLAFLPTDQYVLGLANEERWIEVDLSEQKLIAWEGNKVFMETPVSTGLPWWPTPQGEFRIWIKLRATRMEGGEGSYYYNLPNVPYVMYFYNTNIPKSKGYGLHGAYWHNDFGSPHSHGCVNLPIDAAKNLYQWTNPELIDKKTVIYASENNPGTRILIHE